MLVLTLLACDIPGEKEGRPADAGDTATDTDARDSAPDTGSPPDTADSAGQDDSGDTAPSETSTDSGQDTAADTSGDTAPAVPGPPSWPGRFFGGADLTITPCGTHDLGPYALAPGPDLDGDGLGELAVGAYRAEHDATEQGVVYLVRGADLAGTPSVFSAWAVVPGPSGIRNEYFGERVQWVGDRDGDGVDDLLVGSTRGDVSWVVSGADLAAGGVVAAASEIAEQDAVFARWDDLDGDGAEDWVWGRPNRGMGGPGTRGAVAALLDADFGVAGTPTELREAYGLAATARAGTTIAVLEADVDGDGIREIAASLDGDTVVISSGELLDWATYVDETVLWRFTGMDASDYTTLVALGDVDGGGRDDLLFLHPGTSLCLGRGEDADESGGTATCFDGTDLEVPYAVARGSDLDGDGVDEVWGRTADALVALDVSALVSVAEAARITLAGEASADVQVTVAEGEVWTGAYVPEREEQDAAWAFPEADGQTVADARVVVRGGGWGGDPSVPAWVDATGDGTDDLVFFDDGALDVFDGTGLAAGGARTICDADVHADTDHYDLDWLGDVDGDGVEDALVVAEGETGIVHRVVSGPVLAGLAAGAELASWEGDRAIPWGSCDLTGDGRPELYAASGSVVTFYDAALLTTGDADAARLGAIDREDAYLWCAPDVDGDGGAELVTSAGSNLALILSSRLDPATTLTADDRWVLLSDDGRPAWTSPVALGDLDGDGADEHAWLTRLDVSGTVYSFCFLDSAPLAAGGELVFADAALTCWGEWENLDAYALADVTGDATTDMLLYAADTDWSWAFQAIDGATLADPAVVEPVTDVMPDEDHENLTAGAGADVGGVGSPSLWVRWWHLDVGMWTVEVVFAER